MTTNTSLADTYINFIQPSSFIMLHNGDLKRRRNKLNYKDIYIEKIGYTNIIIKGRRGKSYISKTVNLGKGKSLSKLLEFEKRKLNLSETRKNKHKSFFYQKNDEDKDRNYTFNDEDEKQNNFKGNDISEIKFNRSIITNHNKSELNLNEEINIVNFNLMKEKYNTNKISDRKNNRNKKKIELFSNNETLTLKKIPNDLTQFFSSNFQDENQIKSLKRKLINFEDLKLSSHKNNNNNDFEHNLFNNEKHHYNKIKNITQIKKITNLGNNLKENLGNNSQNLSNKYSSDNSLNNSQKNIDNKIHLIKKDLNNDSFKDFKLIKNKSVEPNNFNNIIQNLHFPLIDNDKLIRNNSYLNPKENLKNNESINNKKNNENEKINEKILKSNNLSSLPKMNNEKLENNLQELKDKIITNDITITPNSIKTSTENTIKQDLSLIQNKNNNINESNNKDNESFSDKDNKDKRQLIKREIIIIENPLNGKRELIDFQNGKKIDDITLIINNEGEEVLINKNTGLPIDMFNYIIDNKTGKKIFSVYEDKNKNKENNNDNLLYKCNDLEIKYNNKTKEECLYNKQTGEKINGIIIKKLPNNKNIFIDKKTGEEAHNIIKNINQETGEEKLYIIKPIKKEKIKIIKIKDPRTKKDILIDMNTGEEIKNILFKEEKGDKKLYDKLTGEEIHILNTEKDDNNNDIYIINKNNVIPKKIEIISIIDPQNQKEILINKNTGKEIVDIEKKINPKTKKEILIDKETNEEIKDLEIKKDFLTGKNIFIIKNNNDYSIEDDNKYNKLKNNNNEFIIIKDPRTKKDILINKKTNEQIKNLEIKEDSNSNEIVFINKETGEKINNIKRIINPKTLEETFIKEENKPLIEIMVKKDFIFGKDILINKNTGEQLDNLEIKKNEVTGEIKLINKETGEEINEINKKISLENGNEIFILNEEMLNPKKIEIILVKDKEINQEKLINKSTGNELTNLERKYDKNKRRSVLINKKTGKIINDIINKIDNETGEETFILNHNNSLSSNPNESLINEILCVKNLKNESEILVNKDNREKVDNLKKNINERNGEIKIINKDNGKEIKDLKTKFDLETGNEVYLLKNRDNKENENINKTIFEQEIICIKDPKGNKDILIDKKTNKILDDLELKKNENGDIYIINKSTGEEIKNVKRKINPETNEEIFIKPIEINNNELYITSIKDSLTGKEILINKNTGEKLDNFEIKINPKTRKSVLMCFN